MPEFSRPEGVPDAAWSAALECPEPRWVALWVCGALQVWHGRPGSLRVRRIRLTDGRVVRDVPSRI